MTMPQTAARVGHDPEGTDRFIVFELGGEAYAVPILRVQEVRDAVRTAPVPRAPEYLLGVTSVRGAIIPVIDMRVRFALQARTAHDRPVFVIVYVRSPGRDRTMALTVDRLMSVRSFSAEDVRLPPDLGHGVGIEFAAGLVSLGDCLVTVLSLDRLLNSGELAIIDEVAS